MKLPEIIKMAVLNEDWGLICKAYTAITGEPLEPPQSKNELDLLNMEINLDILDGTSKNHSQEETRSPSILESEEAFKKKDEVPVLITTEYIINKNDVSNNMNKLKVLNESSYIASAKSGKLQEREDGKKEARREPMQVGNHANRFKDDLTAETADLKENNPILRSVYDKCKARPSRDLIEGAENTNIDKVEVQCAICDETEWINPSLSIGYSKDKSVNVYRCTSCCTPAGRAKAERKKKAENGPRR